MSEKYINLHREIFSDLRDKAGTARISVADVLEWLDEHPDQVPGRTITESEWSEYVNSTNGKYLAGADLLEKAGITVVPDPEPTNAEKLASHVLRITDDLYIGLSQDDIDKIAKWLDAQGVKVTGGES
ncbi:MAG: hypothetical protein ACTIIH_01705 [Brevibacterium sp.]|uniref:hypothetical protein n=1 Tax=Brevibacterium sp. TaxID=1701 RepID=UPI003F8FAE3E